MFSIFLNFGENISDQAIYRLSATADNQAKAYRRPLTQFGFFATEWKEENRKAISKGRHLTSLVQKSQTSSEVMSIKQNKERFKIIR